MTGIPTMRLPPDTFDAIKSGRKRIENRINDVKRRALKIGDEIVFLKQPDCVEEYCARIVGLLYYATFEQMLDDIPMELLGLRTEDRASEKALLRSFYSAADENEFGVVGIRITCTD